jgi:hypothetical protein
MIDGQLTDSCVVDLIFHSINHGWDGTYLISSSLILLIYTDLLRHDRD